MAVGNFGYVWVTTSNKRVFRIHPGTPTSQTAIGHAGIHDLTAGVMKDPGPDQKKIWFAAPVRQDPIVSMVTEGSFPTTVFPLEPNAKAESIKLRTTNIGTPGTPVNAYSLLFAEPENKYIGAIAIPSVAGEIVRMPVAQETWLWDVAVTTAADGKTHTYWATGQKRTSNPVRPENGLYRRSPGQMAWERIEVLRGPDHKPCYIIADTEAVWLTTQNPNMVIRISLADMTVKNEELGTAAPEQLAFGKEGQVWVASSAGLHEFDARLSGPGSLQGLPHGGGAKGLCVGTNGELWYTNPTRKSLGCYTPPPPPFGAATLSGRTQVVSHGATQVQMKDVVERPLVAEYVANGRPIPGIPLTCRVEAQGARFDDGAQERVLLTDQRGQVVLPDVVAGDVEETAVLSVGLGSSEPHAATTLEITPA
ncbi:streptogramin lyase [Streptomyces olivoverticillatus]|uniref:Streptogramin lyase n=1 Tax=Streptomyces olivoverticillatus TaxID=66427 RepID=A0A7W7LUH5_9ACTN|nr:hypothetical protein [Streptomyces olivoverticillatus]MBB4895871.1 streptogramin lyase [Streptomyces olivoverticillatus]